MSVTRVLAEVDLQQLQEPPFFVGWGTLALINAGLAQSKGSSGFVWFLISLFLGPVATLCIVALVDNPRRDG